MTKEQSIIFPESRKGGQESDQAWHHIDIGFREGLLLTQDRAETKYLKFLSGTRRSIFRFDRVKNSKISLTDRQTDRMSDFLGFLSKPKQDAIVLRELLTCL